MLEMQFDAGGRRCVAVVRPDKTPLSCDVGLVVGQEYAACLNSDPAKPLLVQQDKLTSLLIHATKPVIVNVGTEGIPIDPQAPLIWFKKWGTPGPILVSEAPQPITVTATEEGTQLSIVLVQ